MPKENAHPSLTRMWFMAYPPVRESNPSWAPNEIYVFQNDAKMFNRVAARLPNVARLVTEGNVRGQLMRGTMQEAAGSMFVPLNMQQAFNTQSRTPAQHAQEVLALGRASAGLNLVFALPGPVLDGIYRELGQPARKPVPPYDLRYGVYDAEKGQLAFQRRQPIIARLLAGLGLQGT